LYVANFQNSTTLTTTPPTDSTTSDYSLIQRIGIVLVASSSGNVLVSVDMPNQTPNLDDGKVFIGDANNQTEKRGLTYADISGSVSDAKLSANIPIMTNGVMPAVDGSSLTNLPSSVAAPDYVYSIKKYGAYTKYVGANEQVWYNTVTSSRGSSISLNTSNGTFTVAKGKKYKITLNSSVLYSASSFVVAILVNNVSQIASVDAPPPSGTTIRLGGHLTYVADIPAGTGTSTITAKHTGGWWSSSTYTPTDGRSYIYIQEL
jgi:hypothetical protein